MHERKSCSGFNLQIVIRVLKSIKITTRVRITVLVYSAHLVCLILKGSPEWEVERLLVHDAPHVWHSAISMLCTLVFPIVDRSRAKKCRRSLSGLINKWLLQHLQEQIAASVITRKYEVCIGDNNSSKLQKNFFGHF